MKGQALISLIFFAIIAITIVTSSIIMIDLNSISGTKFQQSEIAYQVAESGAQNGLLRVLRDPSYTGEPSVVIGSGTAAISVTGSGTVANPYIIISTGAVGNFIRKTQISATYVNNQLAVISKKEIF